MKTTTGTFANYGRTKGSLLHYFLLPLMVIAISSCSNKELEREAAKKMIIEHNGYPKPWDYDFACGDPSVARKMLEAGMESTGMVTIKKKYNAYRSEALITFTDKAKPYLLPTKDAQYHFQKVKIADEEFGEIKGIQHSGDGKTAIVKYTKVYRNISPFSKMVKGDFTKPKEATAYFALYDNGWQLETKPDMRFLELSK